MLICLMALLLTTQNVPIDSSDVRAIVTAVLVDSVTRDGSIVKATKGRPLVIDLESTNRTFERYAGHPLAPLSDSSLPRVMFWPGAQSQAVDCPPGATELNSLCRVRGDARWVRITRVRDSDSPGELLVNVSVLWTTRLNGASYLTGYTATLALRRTRSGWAVARFLYAAVG
ncbi:MAG: hypothetical protein M3068_09200 [Gemmatimonadota bacterium]|nr:hypothetical protein [Gemmatimonadota bacterium]